MTRFTAAAVRIVAVCTLAMALAPSQARAAYDGLIPSFDGDKKLGPPAASAAGESTVSKVLDAMHPKHAVRATKTTFQKLNSGTKRVMHHTKNMLTPWKRDASKRSPGFLAKHDRKKSTSFLPSWLRREEEKSPPPTLSEWIGRPKP